jgi:sortase A
MPTATPTPTATFTVTPTPVRPLADRQADRVQIPSIDLDSPIVAVGPRTMEENGVKISTWQVADYAVGVNEGSAYPGHPGNTVLTGHHNIKGEVFRYLVDVEIGAQVLLYVGERVYPYVVTEKMILPDKYVPLEQREENARWIEPFPDERLTMVTCWPYTDNTHRVIVVAKPLPEPPEGTMILPE